MGSDEGGTTIGIWIGENETLPAEFDEQLGNDPGYSRSARIKDAMRLYLSVEETIADIGYEFASEAPKRHFVRQALLDETRSEPADSPRDE